MTKKNIAKIICALAAATVVSLASCSSELTDLQNLQEKAKTVTLTFKADGGSWSGSTNDVTLTGKEGAELTAPATPAKTGYTFSAWNPAVPATFPSADTTYTATWAAGTGTAYKVEHYQQNTADDSYTLATDDTQNLTGTTGAQTAAAAKTYTGFTAQTVAQSAIAADGSTVVKIYYTRNTITLTFKANGGNWIGSTADKMLTGRYGATVTITNPVKADYAFVGWDSTVQTTFTADATYTAVWIAPAADAICETVPPASAETTDSYGMNGTYKYFGSWPQTIKASGVTVDTNTTKTMGANTYYLGSDGYWYAKVKAAPYNNATDYTFTNGTTVTKASIYYFKVEPIKWRVLESGKLLAESILANVAYYPYYKVNRMIDGKTVYSNNYQYSRIRAYLNGLSYEEKSSDTSAQTENTALGCNGLL